MKRIFCLLLLLTDITLNAANIKGRVCDAADNSPLAYADVFLNNIQGKVIAWCASDDNGYFALKCDSSEELVLTVSTLGYNPFVSEKFRLSNKTMDLGLISLSKSELSINEAMVSSEKAPIVYKLDRKTVSASASAASEGGTAVDVLSGFPSVIVDGEGELTLRGSSNYLVYVDGKLSPMDGTAALRQIPAGNIEDIEVITTPSARYKTDGDSAIINVKTKKSSSQGWSGLFNLTGSTLGTWGIDGTMNYRKGKNNWYFGGTAQEIKGKSDFSQQKHTSVMGIETLSDSDGERWRRTENKTGRMGWQFSDGKAHSLSVDMTSGFDGNMRGGDMLYDETRRENGTEKNAVYNSHDRYRLGKHLFQTSVEYVWKISPSSELAATSRFRYDWYSIEYTESNMFDLSGNRYEGTRGYEEEHHWDCDGSLTYRYRYSETGNLEIGYQYTTYSEHGGYKIKYWDRDAQEFDWQDDLATPFYYRRQVHSAYAMLNDRWGRVTTEAGLRADRVLDYTDIGIEGSSRDIKRFNVFPSAHIGYDAGRAGSFSLGYSYRTNRPGIWQLEPYITYEDYYTKKIGNPDIRPEYLHAAELGWHKSLSGGNSLSATGFYKYRKDISDWVRSPYEPGITLDQIVNAGNQVETGLELAGVFKVTKWWNLTANASLFNYDFRAKDVSCSDASGLTFLANWMNAFSLKKGLKLQFDSHYVGPRILTQGSEDGYIFFEAAAKKNILKDKMSISLVAHDVLHTARYHNERLASGLSSITTVRPKYPGIVLSLSYNFNSSTHKSSGSQETVLFEGKDF